jgi:hypothetical protein
MRCKRSAAALVALFTMCCAPPAVSKGRPHTSEQLVFSAEDDGVKHPVAIPREVLAILQKEEMVGSVLENEQTSAENIPLDWFSASAIHLSNSRKADLVVMARGPLAGGNVVTFWVFCAAAHGYELALMAPAHTLRVMNTRWLGHRDIELLSASAVQFSSVLCRFDGKRYASYKTKSERIR